jgi:hypothetical protein
MIDKPKVLTVNLSPSEIDELLKKDGMDINGTLYIKKEVAFEMVTQFRSEFMVPLENEIERLKNNMDQSDKMTEFYIKTIRQLNLSSDSLRASNKSYKEYIENLIPGVDKKKWLEDVHLKLDVQDLRIKNLLRQRFIFIGLSIGIDIGIIILYLFYK